VKDIGQMLGQIVMVVFRPDNVESAFVQRGAQKFLHGFAR
jgi:hypothetical protein